MPMHPRPIAETVGPCAPSFRCFIGGKSTLQFAAAGPMTRLIGLVVLAAAAAVAAQEHTYTPAEIESGARLYQSSCVGCHGPDGDMVPGIDLLRGQFRRGTSDAEINRIIRQGIAGTTMPPSAFTEAQA